MRHLAPLIFLIPALAMAQATTAPTSDAETRALLEHLSDDTFQAREDAQDRLVAIGPDAIPALKQFLAAATDPEARTRAETALAQIADNRALGPTPVTIHVKDASAEAVLKELSRQVDWPIPTMPENLFKQPHAPFPRLTMDLDREPLLKAVRLYCERTNLRPNFMGNDRRFVLMQGGDDMMFGPAVFPGAFMVVANSATRSSTINFARDKAAGKSLNIQVSFFAEPKLNILGHDYYLRLSDATDDRGNSLLVPTSPSYNSMGQDNNPRWTLNASLSIPDNLGTKLVRLKGTSRVLLQTRSETWDIPDVTGAASPSKSINGRRYLVEDFKDAGGGESYQFKLTMTRETRAPLVRGEAWQQFGRGVRASLLDAAGKALAARGYGGGGSDEKLSYTYTFSRQTDSGEKTGPPTKLVIEVPTEVKESEIPFEFNDLPLP